THLTWHVASPTGRAKWKKTTSLPRLERLSLDSPREGVIDFLLTEGPGKTVQELVIHAHRVRQADIVAVRAAFDRSSSRRRAEVGTHFALERVSDGIVLRIRVPDVRVRVGIEKTLEGLPRPFVDVVEISGGGEEATYAALLTYGKSGRV